MLTPEVARDYISRCLGAEIDSIQEIRELGGKSGYEVLFCRYLSGDETGRCVLKTYRLDDYSGIGHAGTARKVILASAELGSHGISIPRVLGYHISPELACIVTEWLDIGAWDPRRVVAAAETLANLHNTQLSSLSGDLQKLITDSRTNKDRVRFGVIGRIEFLDKNLPEWRTQFPKLCSGALEMANGVEPSSAMTTLVHGDYFSANLIPTTDAVYVIDWDMLALGDPMWDLGFLFGADDVVSHGGTAHVSRAYQRTRQIDEAVLGWHRECWQAMRELGDVIRSHFGESANMTIQERRS